MKNKSRNERQNERRKANPEKTKEAQRKRNAKVMSDPVLHQKKLVSQRATRKRYLEKYREFDRQRDPLKKAARAKIRHLISDGRLIRMPCEVCGEIKSQAHHEDYSRPLDVKWLCQKHHMEEHKNENV